MKDGERGNGTGDGDRDGDGTHGERARWEWGTGARAIMQRLTETRDEEHEKDRKGRIAKRDKAVEADRSEERKGVSWEIAASSHFKGDGRDRKSVV